MPRLIYSDLSELFAYDPWSGAITHLRKWGRRKVGDVATFPASHGYLRVSVGKQEVYAHRLAWYLMMGTEAPEQIDHVNGNRADNRWRNLRLASNGQNAMNRTKLRNNTSGFKNVHFHKASGLWRVRVRVDGQEIIGGYFSSTEDANQAAIVLREMLHGEFKNA